jgi:hypothetical protein
VHVADNRKSRPGRGGIQITDTTTPLCCMYSTILNKIAAK